MKTELKLWEIEYTMDDGLYSALVLADSQIKAVNRIALGGGFRKIRTNIIAKEIEGPFENGRVLVARQIGK